MSWKAVQVTQKKTWTARWQRAAKRKSANTGDKAGLWAKQFLQYSTSPTTHTLSDRSDGEECSPSTALTGEVL